MSASQLDPEEAAEQESTAHLVSQLAQEAQQRREDARKEAQREYPDFVLEVEQSEVMYTMPPRFLPLKHADYNALQRQMREKWDLALDIAGVKLDALFARYSREEIGALPEDELMQVILRGPDPNVTFRGGKYPVSDFDFVPVLSVRVSYEAVLVSVAGISRIAEAVAAEVVEAISASAGAARPWRMVEPHVQRVGYATRTRVKLGVPFEALLSEATQQFLKESMVSGPKFATHLGHYHTRDGLGPARNAVATYAVDDLTLRFAWFDPDAGVSFESNMQFSITSKGDYGLGIVSVASELPYEVHIECLRQFIDTLSPGAS